MRCMSDPAEEVRRETPDLQLVREIELAMSLARSWRPFVPSPTAPGPTPEDKVYSFYFRPFG